VLLCGWQMHPTTKPWRLQRCIVAQRSQPVTRVADPKLACSPKLPCGVSWVKQNRSARCLTDPKNSAPAAAAKAVYTIIKQTKSRWWEMREPDDEPVPDRVPQWRRGCDRLAA
jgi:hypothetical protein